MKSRIRRRLGRKFRPWGEIAPPRLPDGILALDPHLQTTPDNAVLRVIMFESGMTTKSNESKVGRLPRALESVLVVGAVTLACLLFLAKTWPAALTTLTSMLPPVFWLLLIPLGVGWGAISFILGHGYRSRTRGGLVGDPTGLLLNRLTDLRLAPLTGEDFAAAHWAAVMMSDQFWCEYPAWALNLCCLILRQRCEKESGWSFTPSTVGVQVADRLARGELARRGGTSGVITANGEMLYLDPSRYALSDGESAFPPLGNQFKLRLDTFDYKARFAYLSALWREYLDIYHPEAPEEGEVRRALRPSVYHSKVDEMIASTNNRLHHKT